MTDLVALDGPYAHFPHIRTSSSLNEIIAITTACTTYGISLTLQQPKTAWAGDEVAKRQRLLELAHLVAGGEDAWICIWDADYRLHEPFIGALVLANSRSVDVMFTDDPSDEPSSWYRMKMFIRLEAGMRMAANHHTYVSQFGPSLQVLPRDEDAPLSGVRIQHLKFRRPVARLDQQRSWYEIRDSQKLEH